MLEKDLALARKLVHPFRVTQGKKFRLKSIDPGDTLWLTSEDKPELREALRMGIQVMAEMQDVFYAVDRWALLLVFQAMDAAGKDGIVKHVMSGVNPQGCQVTSFKAPTSVEVQHDYLWRCVNKLPERGRIGIFNRSYYEEVLVVRVHPEFLEKSLLPKELIHKGIWKERLRDIRNFEAHLTHNGTIVRKFFLHVSRAEQKRRFLERLEDPEKHWKFSPNDIRERGFWDDYMHAYEEAIRATATEEAPWYVVPADNKWFTRVVVAAAIVDTLASLGLRYPEVDASKLREFEAARRELLADGRKRGKGKAGRG